MGCIGSGLGGGGKKKTAGRGVGAGGAGGCEEDEGGRVGGGDCTPDGMEHKYRRSEDSRLDRLFPLGMM